MGWQSLEAKARELGFEVRLGSPRGQSKVSTEDGWVRIGRYEAGSGLWARPLNRAHTGQDFAALAHALAGCDPFMMEDPEYDHEYSQIQAPVMAAAAHPEMGCMWT